MMPMADMFAPDINFMSERSVYPTARGGTTASAASAMTPFTNSPVTDPNTGAASATTVAGSPIATSGRSIYWWLGAVVLLVVLVFAARRAGGEEDFRNIRPTAYNFLTIVLTSILGTVGLKVVASKYRIPGASDIILAA